MVARNSLKVVSLRSFAGLLVAAALLLIVILAASGMGGATQPKAATSVTSTYKAFPNGGPVDRDKSQSTPDAAAPARGRAPRHE